ncbi:hypothetical protein ACO3VM_09420 (plasmid) [Methanocaldococcus sp. 10A]
MSDGLIKVTVISDDGTEKVAYLPKSKVHDLNYVDSYVEKYGKVVKKSSSSSSSSSKSAFSSSHSSHHSSHSSSSDDYYRRVIKYRESFLGMNINEAKKRDVAHLYNFIYDSNGRVTAVLDKHGDVLAGTGIHAVEEARTYTVGSYSDLMRKAYEKEHPALAKIVEKNPNESTIGLIKENKIDIKKLSKESRENKNNTTTATTITTTAVTTTANLPKKEKKSENGKKAVLALGGIIVILSILYYVGKKVNK